MLGFNSENDQNAISRMNGEEQERLWGCLLGVLVF
ncbi:hypothetical protein A8938_1175 [Algoriphagus zhangzhouensis]|nr:hypothetical protein A8938_1175 [Algoriphagus zhangzhouensis]